MTARWHWYFKLGWGVDWYTDVYYVSLGFVTLWITAEVLHEWRLPWKSAKKSDVTTSNQSGQSATCPTSSLLINPPFGLSGTISQTNSSPFPFLGRQLPQAQSPPSSASPPTIEGPVLAWRMFICEWTDEGYKLHSVVVGCNWDGPTMKDDVGPNTFDEDAIAGRISSYATISLQQQGYGFFSVRERSSAQLAVFGAKMPTDRIVHTETEHNMLMVASCSVLGQVECFGEIVEYQDGYRSQGQTIQRLVVPLASIVADLEWRYQCDVTVEPDVFVWNRPQITVSP